jgi:exodeoxyribonuclease-3
LDDLGGSQELAGCHLATPALAATAKAEKLYLAQRFSDHAPLIIDYGFEL